MKKVPAELVRQVYPCLGLWEYTHTNEDGVAQYRLIGVTEDDEAANQWYETGLGFPVLYVTVTRKEQS